MNGIYFLTCRDAALAFPGLSHQGAYNVNLALAQLGAIEVVRAGDAYPGGKASEFRYLLGDITTAVEEEDTGVEI